MSTPTIGVNNPYPGVIPLSKDYRKLQAGSLMKKQEQLVVDKSDGDNPPSLAERVTLIEIDGLGWTRAKERLDRLTASSQELNDTVAKAPASGAPTIAVAAKAIATFGAEPTDGDKITIGTKTYRFRDKPLGAAVAASGEWTDSTNTLTVTFASAGASGNGFKVNLIDPGAETANTTAVLNVDGVTIDVTLSNSAVPAINATLAGVKAAIEANPACNALVSCAITGSGTTVIDDTDITLSGGIDAQAENDVYSGGSATAAIDNLVTAITTGYTLGVVGTGTVAHPLATAVKKDSDEMTCTAILGGDAGNLIDIAASVGGDITWDETGFLDGGVDGTVAPAGAMRFASGELWVSVEESTISESHWQKATLT